MVGPGVSDLGNIGTLIRTLRSFSLSYGAYLGLMAHTGRVTEEKVKKLHANWFHESFSHEVCGSSQVALKCKNQH